MKVIGLTGGTGSGKSVVSRSLAAAGAVIVDADKIAHEIILKGEPAYQEIIEYYGTGILDEEGNIIRKKLGEIVFNDKEKLAFLNQCTHKYITAEVKRQIAEAKEENKVYTFVDRAYDLLKGLDLDADSLDDLYNAFNENNIAIIWQNKNKVVILYRFLRKSNYRYFFDNYLTVKIINLWLLTERISLNLWEDWPRLLSFRVTSSEAPVTLLLTTN